MDICQKILSIDWFLWSHYCSLVNGSCTAVYIQYTYNIMYIFNYLKIQYFSNMLVALTVFIIWFSFMVLAFATAFFSKPQIVLIQYLFRRETDIPNAYMNKNKNSLIWQEYLKGRYFPLRWNSRNLFFRPMIDLFYC